MDSFENVCSLANVVRITSVQEMLLTIKGLAGVGRRHAQEFDGLDQATANCLFHAIENLADCVDEAEVD